MTDRLKPPSDDGENWLDWVIDAGRLLPMSQPPEALTRSLEDLFTAQVDVQWSEAKLIRDSRYDEALAGVRGPSDGAGEVPGEFPHDGTWTATYCATAADVVIDGSVRTDGSTTASGQIFPLEDGSSAFRITLEGPRSAAAYTDDLGQFELGSLPPGAYVLRASNDRIGVTLTFDAGDSGGDLR